MPVLVFAALAGGGAGFFLAFTRGLPLVAAIAVAPIAGSIFTLLAAAWLYKINLPTDAD